MACSNSITPTTSVTSMPTSISTPSLTKTPHISPTPIPTIEVVITPTNPIFSSQEVTTLQALANQYNTRRYDFYCTSKNLPVTSKGVSINGDWLFIEEKLRVINPIKKIEWDLTPFLDETYGIHKGISIRVVHWSKNERYLYFATCNTADTGITSDLLYKLDLKTGEISNTNFDYDSVFSPDDQYIVYKHEKSIRIHEFQSGAEFYVDMSSYDFDNIGWFVWSSDQKQIAFTTQKIDERNYGYLDKYYVYILNLEDLSIHPLIESHTVFQGYYTISWTEPNLITLERFDLAKTAVYDLKNKKLYLLSYITPTP